MRTPPLWLHLGLLLLIPFAIYLRSQRTQTSAIDQTELTTTVVPESVATPTPTPETVAASAPRKIPFVELTRETLEKLPTVEAVRRKHTNFHRPPPELSEGAAALSEVENRLREEPALVREGLDFFRSCATDDRVLSALRAVCLRSLQDWAKKAKLTHLVRREEFPERIHYVADQLPSLR